MVPTCSKALAFDVFTSSSVPLSGVADNTTKEAIAAYIDTILIATECMAPVAFGLVAAVLRMHAEGILTKERAEAASMLLKVLIQLNQCQQKEAEARYIKLGQVAKEKQLVLWWVIDVHCQKVFSTDAWGVYYKITA
jgi:hypothetical protein